MSHAPPDLQTPFAGTANWYARYRPPYPDEFLSDLRSHAEDLQLPAGSLELITFGEAFHRMDQKRVLERALTWLGPRGALATLGGEPVWRGPERWKRVLVGVVNKWTNQTLGDPNDTDWGGPVEALRAVGLQVQEREFVAEHIWTCDSILGFMLSTSI